MGALVTTALAVLSQLYAAIPLLAPVDADLGGDATFALPTVYGLCYAAGFLLWGPIADRHGLKRVMTAGLALLVLVTLGCAFAGPLPILAVLRGVQGLAAVSFASVALAYLGEAVSLAPDT
ncbi:MFS transporter [Nocardiopsis aegyptia]